MSSGKICSFDFVGSCFPKHFIRDVPKHKPISDVGDSHETERPLCLGKFIPCWGRWLVNTGPNIFQKIFEGIVDCMNPVYPINSITK